MEHSNRRPQWQNTSEYNPSDPFKSLFQCAAANIPSSVAVLTAQNEAGAVCGITVSSLAVASFDPPILAVCLRRPVADHSCFGISVLREDQRDLTKQRPLGSPWIDGAIAWFDCRVHRALDVGSHRMFLGEVERYAAAPGRPLIYWRRAFHALRIEYPMIASDTTLDTFVSRWEAGALPREAWTHGAHVAVTAYYAYGRDEKETYRIMSEGIPRFNSSVGTPNTEDSGYHETLTRLWVTVIQRWLQENVFASRLDAVRAAVEEFGEARDLHHCYYTFDVARDRHARKYWTPPDRELVILSNEEQGRASAPFGVWDEHSRRGRDVSRAKDKE